MENDIHQHYYPLPRRNQVVQAPLACSWNMFNPTFKSVHGCCRGCGHGERQCWHSAGSGAAAPLSPRDAIISALPNMASIPGAVFHANPCRYFRAEKDKTRPPSPALTLKGGGLD